VRVVIVWEEESNREQVGNRGLLDQRICSGCHDIGYHFETAEELDM